MIPSPRLDNYRSINALAQSVIGLYKTGCVRHEGPWRGVDDLELATLNWVAWFNEHWLHGEIGYVPPVEYETTYYALQGAEQAEPLTPEPGVMISPRDENVTTTPMPSQSCPACGAKFIRVRRQRYCSPACRQSAYRARHHSTPPPLPITRASPRRDNTVYACPECEQRYHGLQWCHDCNRPCRRLGPGGACPHCDELLSNPPR